MDKPISEEDALRYEKLELEFALIRQRDENLRLQRETLLAHLIKKYSINTETDSLDIAKRVITTPDAPAIEVDPRQQPLPMVGKKNGHNTKHERV